MTRGTRNYSRALHIFFNSVSLVGKTQPPTDSGYKGAGACASWIGCCRMLCTCCCKVETSPFNWAIWPDRFGISRAPDTEMTGEVFCATGVFGMSAALAANGPQIPAAESKAMANLRMRHKAPEQPPHHHDEWDCPIDIRRGGVIPHIQAMQLCGYVQRPHAG